MAKRIYPGTYLLTDREGASALVRKDAFGDWALYQLVPGSYAEYDEEYDRHFTRLADAKRYWGDVS